MNITTVIASIMSLSLLCNAEAREGVSTPGGLQLITAEDEQAAPLLHVDNDTHDFGNIVGEVEVSHNFVVRNDGNAPLVIIKALTDCGCTVADFPKEPIMPGVCDTVKVTFNTKGRHAGYFTKLVRITTNSSEKAHRLYIKGRVLKRKH